MIAREQKGHVASDSPRRLVRSFLLFLILTAVALWLWDGYRIARFATKLGFFPLRDVEVVAEWPLTREEVRGWLPPLEGTSLLDIDLAQILALVESKRWVESAIVKREYPERLRIEIQTRKAEALLFDEGQLSFLAAGGGTIDRATPDLLRTLDLPVLSGAESGDRDRWLTVLTRVRQALEPEYRISELHVSRGLGFRVFLVTPPVEVVFSVDNWEEQLPLLVKLLNHAPPELQNPKKINLVFPKKAVVSSDPAN